MSLENAKILMIIAHFEFRDEEYQIPREIFDAAGAQITVASSSTHTAHGIYGLQVDPDITVEQIHVRDYDAVVFVGGHGIQEYMHNGTITRIIQESYHDRILLGAICSAPVLLANAGILANKKITGFIDEKQNLETAGAFYTGRLIEQDGEVITASGPEAARDFGHSIVKSLQWRKERKGYLV